MKKILVSICVCMCATSFMFAQTNSAKAKTILDEVSATTKSYSTISVDFTFVHQTKDEASTENKTSGTLLLKGNKYVLQLFGNKLFYNGKSLWTYMIEEKEVVVSNVDESSESSFNPAKMLTIYEEGFKYQFVQERFEQGRALQVIDLFPKDLAKSEYSRVRLSIDKDKKQIWKIEYFAKDENTYTITVVKYQTNLAVADADFVFDASKYPGVMVIDER